jgi:hypothetical protein
MCHKEYKGGHLLGALVEQPPLRLLAGHVTTPTEQLSKFFSISDLDLEITQWFPI